MTLPTAGRVGNIVRAKSAKAARAHRARINRLKRTTHGPERCQWPWGCARTADDAHESRNRSQGGDATDPDWLLCRQHHDTVTAPAPGMRDVYIAAGLIRTSPVTKRTYSRTVRDVPKRALTIRIPESADAWLQDVIKTTGTSQATAVRAMLSVATSQRPAVIAKIKQLDADA